MTNLSITDIKSILDKTTFHDLNKVLLEHEKDTRKGVQKLVVQYRKKILNYQQELSRLKIMRAYEEDHEEKRFIGGIDEAGRGPLAGPVVSAAVILPKDVQILYVNDSKKVSKAKREALYEEIYEKAVAVSVGISNVNTIDDINILNATYKAMQTAVNSLEEKPDLLLVDAVTIPDIDIEQISIIKGDAKSISIAAASIIAKVTRDNMMLDYDMLYPEYGFAQHKGYGTREHIDALKKYGPCPIHRKTFIQSII